MELVALRDGMKQDRAAVWTRRCDITAALRFLELRGRALYNGGWSPSGKRRWHQRRTGEVGRLLRRFGGYNRAFKRAVNTAVAVLKDIIEEETK